MQWITPPRVTAYQVVHCYVLIAHTLRPKAFLRDRNSTRRDTLISSYLALGMRQCLPLKCGQSRGRGCRQQWDA